MNYIIRTANENDAQNIHDAYEECVKASNITFTLQNPTVEEYREKIIHTLKTYPFYVAESEDGKFLGYVYGTPLRPHDAYKWNVESTIVLAPDAPRRCGIATALYGAFFETLLVQGFKTVFAVIVDGNIPSIALHESLGFEGEGKTENIGYKDGEWKNILWYKKQIAPYDTPIEPIPFSELDK